MALLRPFYPSSPLSPFTHLPCQVSVWNPYFLVCQCDAENFTWCCLYLLLHSVSSLTRPGNTKTCIISRKKCFGASGTEIHISVEGVCHYLWITCCSLLCGIVSTEKKGWKPAWTCYRIAHIFMLCPLRCTTGISSEKQPLALKCIGSVNLHQPLKATCFPIMMHNVKNMCCVAYVKFSSHFK